MNKTKGFICLGIFYLFGIFINNFLENIYMSLLILPSLVIFFLFLFFIICNKNILSFMLLALLGFTFGIYISDYYIEKTNKKLELVNHFRNKEQFEVEIKKISKTSEEKTIYLAKVLTIGEYRIKEKITIEVSINGNYILNKGDIIKFNSKIYKYEPFNNFKYDKYMFSNGIYFRVYSNNFIVVGNNNINFIISLIDTFRKKVLLAIKNIYPYEEGIFLGGILIGAREEIPENLKNNFNNSGLTHIIAVSGFNITILIIFISYVFKLFPPILRFILVTFFIIIFAILVGYSAPVIRATIMGIIGYYVLISGRKGNSLAMIILTAIIMATISPLSINYDISFHLSFLSVLGIMYINPFFEKIFKRLPNILEVRTALSLTLSALVFTLPIIIFNFGKISLISPISNILVSWTIPLIMLISSIGLLAYFILSNLGIFISYFSWILLKWDIIVINTFGSMKFASIDCDFGKYKSFYSILYFLLLIAFIIYISNKKRDN